jgi:hypothetical protein
VLHEWTAGQRRYRLRGGQLIGDWGMVKTAGMSQMEVNSDKAEHV